MLTLKIFSCISYRTSKTRALLFNIWRFNALMDSSNYNILIRAKSSTDDNVASGIPAPSIFEYLIEI